MYFKHKFCVQNHLSLPLYIENEMSFCFDPPQKKNFSIYIQGAYTSLDMNLDTGKVVQLTGYNPRISWRTLSLKVPAHQSGIIQVAGLEERIAFPGLGVYYTHEWETFFDSATGWVCIGNPQDSEDIIGVEFAKNTVAILNDSKLLAVWVKPVFVHSYHPFPM